MSAIAGFLGASRPSLIVIDGDAGIGKTTLWTFAADASARRGDRVLSWAPTAADHGVAFGALRALLGPVAEAAAELVAPRRTALMLALATGTRDAGNDAPTPEAGALGLAVTDALRAIAAAGPLTIAIDDLQWCDPASEDVLTFAIRRVRAEPVACLVAARTGTRPVSAGLTAAFPEDRTHRLTVGPVSVGALGRIIHERLGVIHPRPTLIRLHDACRGNPFLALEISRSLLARNIELGAAAPFPVAPHADSLIRDRLSGISADARRALLIASMSPQPTLSLLERILGPPAEAATEETYLAGVLQLAHDRVRPAHPLLAATAYADASLEERRSLRAALAEAATDPVERALHLADIATAPDASASAALADAAASAAARGATAAAADLFERAAGLAEATERRGSLLIAAGRASDAAGDAAHAESLLSAALDALPAGPQKVEALLALANVVYLDRPATTHALLRDALRYAAGDRILEATVHCHIAGMGDADPEAWHRSAMAAVELIDRPGIEADPDLLAAALLERAYVWLLRGERMATGDVDRAVGMLSRQADTFVARRARELAQRCLHQFGRLDEALAMDRAEYERLKATGQTGLIPHLLQALIFEEIFTGDWAEARAHLAELEDAVEGGEEVWRERLLASTARYLGWAGRIDEARALALQALADQEAAGDLWDAASLSATLGSIELSVPNPEAAVVHLTRVAEYADSFGIVLPTAFRYLGDLVEAAVRAGDVDLAERTLVERLERPTRTLPLPWAIGAAARGRGFLAEARGDLDESIEWFGRSLDAVGGSAPMPLERARTLFARGHAHLAAGHRAAARTDLEAALDVFAGVGAAVWAERVRAETARIGGRVRAAESLTGSERRVAGLAARGLSNREIATELFVSVRTVETQLSAVYRKLGVRSRAALSSRLP